MKIDSLRQYLSSRSALLNEKEALEKRLAQINQALRVDGSGVVSPVKAVAVKPVKPLPRIKNPMSLKAAVIKVTTPKPLTKREILTAIHKVGYRFATMNPLKSLDVILYSQGNFKRANGKFSPAK